MDLLRRKRPSRNLAQSFPRGLGRWVSLGAPPRPTPPPWCAELLKGTLPSDPPILA